jgi:PKD repeat protein/lysophospholipase L1-like esterase
MVRGTRVSLVPARSMGSRVMRPHRPIRLAIAVTATVLLQLGAVGSASAEALPGSMASTGDSITRAFNTSWFPFIDAPGNSWSTGSSTTVNSHYRRILASNPGISGRNFNDAVSGAQMANLAGQMQTVAGRNVDYVTVLMGGNDVCRDSEAQMTSVQAFHDQFVAAMNMISASASQPLVYVVSIPSVYNLWAVLKDSLSARSTWSLYNVCQSMLANPLSTAQADVDRRARVAQRDVDFNSQLAAVCALYPRCRFDGKAVFNTAFTASDISTRDYFHPSVAGQAKLASVSWQAGPFVAPPPNQPPVAAFRSRCLALSCTFTDASSDPDGNVSSWAWTFGDGQSDTAQSPTHTYAGAGTYSVTLTTTDDDGATGTANGMVTVTAALTKLHVGALSGSSARAAKRNWTASALITVHDATHETVGGVTVSGSFSGGGSTSCTTSSAGSCTITSGGIPAKTGSVTFAVSALSKTGATYDSAANEISSIVVLRP